MQIRYRSRVTRRWLCKNRRHVNVAYIDLSRAFDDNLFTRHFTARCTISKTRKDMKSYYMEGL